MTDLGPDFDVEEASRVPREDKAFHSSRISESCRYIGFGLVVFYYGLVTANPPIQGGLVSCIGFYGVATLLADYFQYLGGYVTANKALDNPRRNYKKNSIAFKMQLAMFWVKQVAAIAGSLALATWVLGYRF